MNNNVRRHIAWWLIFLSIRTPEIMNITNSKFSFRKQLRSFAYAFNGLKILIKEEHNFRIHLTATFFALIASLILKIEKLELLIILSTVVLVFACEIINTAIENLSNFVSPEYHNQIKKVKDLSAAAVLISAVFAFVIGAIIFSSKIF